MSKSNPIPRALAHSDSEASGHEAPLDKSKIKSSVSPIVWEDG